MPPQQATSQGHNQSQDVVDTAASASAAQVVFVVDDDPLVTSSVEAFLSLTFDDLVIHTFNNPEVALATLIETPPRLVISDFLMPEMDGIALLSAVREKHPETTTILLTGYADKENAIAAVNQAGIFKYLEKPWRNEDLQLAVENGLERAQLLEDLRTTVTQLQEAQEALTQYNQQLEGIVEERTHDVKQALAHLDAIVRGSGDGIVTVTEQGQVLSVNPTMAEWVAHVRANQLAEDETFPHINGWLMPLANQPAKGDFWTTARTGEQDLLEARIGDRPVEVGLSCLSSEPGQLVATTATDAQTPAWVLIVRDLTRRKAEERLREDFVATLTHDLRVPILAAIQTLELMANGAVGPMNDKQLELARMLVTNNQDLLSLVNTLLDIYKYESGQKQLLRQPVPMENVGQQVLNQLQAMANSKQKNLKLVAPAGLPSVTGDKQELQRVVTNLVGNAIQHTPANGSVTVRLETAPHPFKPKENPKGLAVSVEDTGRGIPPEDIPKLFMRFAQGTRQVRSSGSGLGLYLSRQIVARHGGELTVTSTVGQGSCFTVWLPL